MAKIATLEEMVSEVLADDVAAKADMQELREQDAAAFEIGKPPRTAIVNTVDAKGEAIAVEVPIEALEPPHADDGYEATPKPTLPGFEALVVDAIAVNISGRPDINFASPMDRAFWEACRRGARFTAMVDVVVGDMKDHPAHDKDWNLKERTGSVQLKVRRVYLPEFAGWAELQDDSGDTDEPEPYATVN